MPTAYDHTDAGTVTRDRFVRRAHSIATLLSHRLEVTSSLHDLSEKRLWASHRSVADLHRRRRAPSAAAFWEATAQPGAGHFLDEAVEVIDSERVELTRALQRFATAVGEQARWDAMQSTDAAPGWGRSTAGARRPAIAHLTTATTGIELFLAAASTGHRINEVGAWWQGRLRRAALLSNAARLLVTPIGRFDAAVSAAEMKLLAEPPWCHDDRLLSAYELAHSDLRRHITTVGADLNRQARAMLDQAIGVDRRDDDTNRRATGRPTSAATAEAIELG